MSRRLAPGTLRAVLRRPTIIPAALRSALAMAPVRWWRRAPFLPLPDPSYWRFRIETSMGGAGEVPPSPSEIVDVVKWTSKMRRLR